jgi:hypothetical protein
MTPKYLTEVLQFTYDLSDDLQLALEAFLRKTYSETNLEKFVANPGTMYKLLSNVVYDDLGGFSYLDDWQLVADGEDYFEPKAYVWKYYYDGRESDTLHYLKDCSEVDYTQYLAKG